MVEDPFIELEEALAILLEKSHVIFSAGYLACASSVAGFVGRKDIVLADKNLHSSLWSGIKLSGAHCERFAHNHPEHLREILEAEDKETGKAVVLEGIYSMEGHIARLPELTAIAKEFDCFTILDDAHGFGVLGNDGRGTADHFGLTDEIDVISGSFSKSLSGIGGFVASSKQAIEFMRSHSKQTIFSAALTPVACACAKAALQVMQDEPEHRERLFKNLERIHLYLKNSVLIPGRAKLPLFQLCSEKRRRFIISGKLFLKKAFTPSFQSLQVYHQEKT